MNRKITTNASNNINIGISKNLATVYGYEYKVQVSTSEKKIIHDKDDESINLFGSSTQNPILGITRKGITGIECSLSSDDGGYVMKVRACSGTDIVTPKKIEFEIIIRTPCKINIFWNELQQRLNLGLESPLTNKYENF